LDSVAEVTNVTNLAQARKLIGQDELDVVILDWSLPDGDARSLLEDITRLHPAAKIISLSADNNREPDPRVGINLVKSRSGISSVVNSITGTTARAS
jgi:DNA-binding response OmpR family regulator